MTFFCDCIIAYNYSMYFFGYHNIFAPWTSIPKVCCKISTCCECYLLRILVQAVKYLHPAIAVFIILSPEGRRIT
jgi:ABC-type thiamin/hydroxymethylpyrimidine transport system permease subunit